MNISNRGTCFVLSAVGFSPYIYSARTRDISNGLGQGTVMYTTAPACNLGKSLLSFVGYLSKSTFAVLYM